MQRYKIIWNSPPIIRVFFKKGKQNTFFIHFSIKVFGKSKKSHNFAMGDGVEYTYIYRDYNSKKYNRSGDSDARYRGRQY